MFRFNEDKKTVEEVLKARTNAINAAQFTKKGGGSTLLRGGPGGRGGRGSAPGIAGRGGVAGRGRPVAPSAAGNLTRQLSSSSMSPRGSSRKSPGKVTEEAKPARKNPEICPEDSQSESPSPSNSVTQDPSLDFVSPVKRVAVVEPILTTPVASTMAEETTMNTATTNNTIRSSTSRVVDALSDSPNTDSETSTMYSCGTPREASDPTTRTETSTEEATKAKLSPVLESKAPSTSSTPVEGLTTSSASPVPFVITARAIQKAPTAPTSRRGSSHSHPASSVTTPTLTPTLTPSTSNTNLAALGASHTSAAPVAVAPSSTHSAQSTRSNHSPVPPPVTQSSGGLSTSIAAYKDFDLAPMVADCKPEKGVSSLKSMFSGTGGTNSNKSLPPKAPMDFTPAKTRPSDAPSAFAFKPATSTANSLRLFRPADTSYAGSIDARSLAPAPIVIPGATLSLAEMRAKFTRTGSEANSPAASPFKHALTDPSRRATHSVQGSPVPSSTEEEPRVLIRRHSDFALGSNSNTDAAVLAALNAAYSPISCSSNSSSGKFSTGSTASAETAGAGADLAQRCATALNMSRGEFLFLEREEALFVPAVSIDATQGPQLPQYTYREVVRRNFVKVYEELNQSELELYVSDEDFAKAFGRTKVGIFRVYYVELCCIAVAFVLVCCFRGIIKPCKYKINEISLFSVILILAG